MKTKIVFTLVVIVFAFFMDATAQLNELWVSRYDGTAGSTDEFRAMAVDNLGNVYVTGKSFGPGGNRDYATVKYNPSGDTVWVRRFDGGGAGNPTDEAADIAVDALGNVYISGSSVGMDFTSDFLTIKYDSNGDTVWTRRYSHTAGSNDDPNSLAIDEMGFVYVTGRTNGDYLTVAYDAAGIFQWASVYNGPGNDRDIARKIIYKSGSLYVTGTSRNTFNSSTSADYATIKYNTAGDSAWVRRYNGPGDNFDQPTAIEADSTGNIYVTGFSRNTSVGSSADYLTIKYDTFGDSLWVARYDGPLSGMDEANDLVVDNAGNVYVTGSSVGTFSDYVTIKYDSSGDSLWVARYHGPFNTSNDYGHSIALDGTGSVYVTGGSQVSSISTTDVVTIKYNSSGAQQWLRSYDGTGSGGDVGYEMEVYNTNFVYVCGNSTGSGSALDYITIKYEKTTGINPVSHNTPDGFKLHQNYPNPFNPTTKIRFEIPQAGFVSLRIFDVLGRETAVLYEGQLSAGSFEYVWDASGSPGGVYFYRLETADYKEVKKLILNK